MIKNRICESQEGDQSFSMKRFKLNEITSKAFNKKIRGLREWLGSDAKLFEIHYFHLLQRAPGRASSFQH